MNIEYVVPLPQGNETLATAHILRVGLRGFRAEPGTSVEVDGYHEVPVRRSVYEALPTDADKIAYALECERWHHRRDASVRAAWDADDQAQADAAAAAAQAVEYARLIVTPTGFATDEKGAITGVQVTITHQGYTCSAVIDPDPATKEANALAAWTASKAQADARAALLASFAIG